MVLCDRTEMRERPMFLELLFGFPGDLTYRPVVKPPQAVHRTHRAKTKRPTNKKVAVRHNKVPLPIARPAEANLPPVRVRYTPNINWAGKYALPPYWVQIWAYVG